MHGSTTHSYPSLGGAGTPPHQPHTPRVCPPMHAHSHACTLQTTPDCHTQHALQCHLSAHGWSLQHTPTPSQPTPMPCIPPLPLPCACTKTHVPANAEAHPAIATRQPQQEAAHTFLTAVAPPSMQAVPPDAVAPPFHSSWEHAASWRTHTHTHTHTSTHTSTPNRAPHDAQGLEAVAPKHLHAANARAFRMVHRPVLHAMHRWSAHTHARAPARGCSRCMLANRQPPASQPGQGGAHQPYHTGPATTHVQQSQCKCSERHSGFPSRQSSCPGKASPEQCLHHVRVPSWPSACPTPASPSY